MVEVAWPRSKKGQELERGHKSKNKKAKDLCRRVSPIMTGQSPRHHRTELILPESKHSLTA